MTELPEVLDLLAPRDADEAQRLGSEAQVEHASAELGDVVVVALGDRVSDELDLRLVEAELPVELARLAAASLRVRQEDLRAARLEQEIALGRVEDVGQALAHEDDRAVALAQNPEPLLDLRGEDRVVEEQPRLLEDEEARLARETPLDLVEEIEKNRDGVLLALVHEVLDLEDLEVGVLEAVLFGVQEMPHRALEGVVAEPAADGLVLDRAHEVRERAVGALHEPLERRVDLLALLRSDGHLLQGQQVLDPFRGPDPDGGLVDVGQGAEGQVVALVAGDVVVDAAHGVAEREGAVALVEREDLGARVAQELGGDESDERGLSRARGSDHHRMAHVGDVEVEPEGRGAGRVRVEEGRGAGRVEGAGILLEPREDRGRRDQVGEVQRVQERPSHVPEPVAGKRAEERLDGVDGLDTRLEAVVLELALDLAALGLEVLPVLAVEQDHARVVAEAHVHAGGLGDGGIRVVGHHHGILVGEGLPAHLHGLADEPRQAVSLLEPVASRALQELLGRRRLDRYEAIRPSVLEREPVQEVEDPGEGVAREAADRDGAHPESSHAELESPHEILRADDRVEIERRMGHADRVRDARGAGAEEAQEVAGVHALDGQSIGERVLQVGGAALEVPECRLPARRSVGLVAVDEERAQPVLHLGWRQVAHGEGVEALERGLPALVDASSLVVDQPRRRVGEEARFGVAGGGLADRIGLDHPAVPEVAERSVHLLGQDRHLVRRGRLHVRARVPPAGEERAVLVEQDAFVDQRVVVQEIGEAFGLTAELGQHSELLQSE